MRIVGVKLTHDGGFAVIDENELICSVEMEKLHNNPRHEPCTLDALPELLEEQGIPIETVDRLSIDGWWHPEQPYAVDEKGGIIATADYIGFRVQQGKAVVGGEEIVTSSHPHALDHVYAAYCSSPYVDNITDVLVWDGGMDATLYGVDPRFGITQTGVALPIMGSLYQVVAGQCAPYRSQWLEGPRQAFGPDGLPFGDERWSRFSLSVPGKAMAYAGLGELDDKLVRRIMAALEPVHTPEEALAWTERWWPSFSREVGDDDATAFRCFQEAIGRKLIEGLRNLRPDPLRPLCFVGGCSLNIKWNSMLRESEGDVWVPPFTNDSGVALGAACAEMVRTGDWRLQWNVFAGPKLAPPPSTLPDGWRKTPFSIAQLADHLARIGEPVVLLAGRAELGPRALGHRSIIAPATDPDMKTRLNRIKHREDYRPVAPVCLVEDAPDVFDPGCSDPYMLFDHDIRPEWRDRIPAVMHNDGSARLQTVDQSNQPLRSLLAAYWKITDVPVLCNTSANLLGRGFFPDAMSAMEWGGCNYVWQEGTLYVRTG